MKTEAFAALFLAAVVSPALAQDAEPGDITQVYYVEPKAGQGAEFNAGWAEYWACYKEHGGKWAWSAWTPVSGKLGGVYFRSSGHHWADFDAEDPADKACNDVFEKSLLPHFGDVYENFQATLRDVSHPGDGPNNLVLVYDIEVSDSDAAMGVIKAWNEAFQAADKGRYVWLSWVTTSSGWDYSVALLNENYADMAPDDPSFDKIVSDHYGAEKAAELMATWRKVVKRSRARMLKRDTTLSYSPNME